MAIVKQQLTRALLVGSLLAGCAASGPIAGPVDVKAPAGQPATTAAPEVPLPTRDGSLKFAVLGDFGDGSRRQYDVAAMMVKRRATFPFELVALVGDNMYGSQGPRDYERKFAIPYKPLLDAGVKFYASLGNHDDLGQRFYEHFNMNGRRYYSFKAPKQDVRFFAIDSTYLVPEQLTWLDKELQGSGENWKIAYFHHPPYSSGDRHGSDVVLREALEPLFIKYNVSVVFNGHDHFYERIKPQNGVAYFVVGSGGKLRRGNIEVGTGLTARGFDDDNAFLAAEIDGDEMFFNAISRLGRVVDSGIVVRRKPEELAHRQ
jgi:predicted MPP superfamily phosphohydrolase